jgi:hypothetical protein
MLSWCFRIVAGELAVAHRGARVRALAAVGAVPVER